MFQAIEKTVMEIIADPLKIDNLQRQAHHRHVSWLKQAYDERYLAKYQWAAAVRRAGFAFVQLSAPLSAELWSLLPGDTWLSWQVLPFRLEHNTLFVVTLDPFREQLFSKLARWTGYAIRAVVVDQADWQILSYPYTALRLSKTDLSLLSADPPAVETVQKLLHMAVLHGCSDLHLEPDARGMRIRFRLDGILLEGGILSAEIYPQVVSRLKILAGMDIAEKRLPQDGRFSFNYEQSAIDCRVATLPLAAGEKVAVRLLDRHRGLRGLKNLDLSPDNCAQLKELLHLKQGMILLTGATGTGKTTTLYALLSELNTSEVNIITLEDPIEYSLAGINQMQINPRSQLDFAHGLRSVLRQDPDIIMVGEIRDEETARLALQASLTGHLVFSTLHTKKAVSAVIRLRDMGIESFWLAGALTAVVSQRLLRRLCPYCRQSYELSRKEALHWGLPECSEKIFYRATGCEHCQGLGYSGRIALHEILILDESLESVLLETAYNEELLERTAVASGMKFLRDDFLYKARQGEVDLKAISTVW